MAIVDVLERLGGKNEPIWLPTAWLETEMSSKVAWRQLWGPVELPFKPAENNGVVRGKIRPLLKPVKEHKTIIFIDQLFRGIAPLDTTLWHKIESGERIKRWNKTQGKIEIDTGDKFKAYADRVMDMLSFSKVHGILPIASASNRPTDRIDVDIGFAMLEEGVYFYQKGHHRLGFARVLEIELVPCRCYFASEKAIEHVRSSLQKEKSLVECLRVLGGQERAKRS
jgi:hypothetical protein